MGATLSLATVVFRTEVDLLRLQARSIARFFDLRDVVEIVLIVNDRKQSVCAEQLVSMLECYGPARDLVRIVLPDELFAARARKFGPRGLHARLRHVFTAHRDRYPLGVKDGWRGNRGWSVQQAFKLQAARLARGDVLLILDAKNHFIAPAAAADFLAPDGRPRTYLVAPNDKQWSWIEASFARMEVPLPQRQAGVPPSVTPFCVAREQAISCVDALEASVGPAETFFARKNTHGRGRPIGSEFMFLFANAVSLHGGWMTVCAPGLQRAATIHRNSSFEEIDAVLDRVEAKDAMILSVHRARLARLRGDQVERLAEIWRKAGLDAREITARLRPVADQAL